MAEKNISKLYLGGLVVLIIALFYNQGIKGEYFLKKAKNNYVRVIPQRAIRGTIFDRNNIPLAYDKATFNLAVIPCQINKRKERLFKDLGIFLRHDWTIIEKNYKKNLTNLVSPVNIVLNLPKDMALKAREQFGEDILINPQPQRYYPYAYECGHILGYLREDKDIKESIKKYNYFFATKEGAQGIERYYEDDLKGTDGGYFLEVSAKGQILGFLGERDITSGKNLSLTIDQRLQKLGYEVLAQRRGVLIIMDSQNGEVLCYNSSPSFDPNSFIKGKEVTRFLNNKENPMISRGIQALYPLGSVFKPIEVLAALEEGKINKDTSFICNGKVELAGKSFKCLGVHSEENYVEALVHSCNVFFYNLGQVLGGEMISIWAKKFGLDSFTGVDLAYEKNGLVPSPQWKGKQLRESWYLGDTLNFSIGQGYMKATPFEALVAINIFATNGYYIRPYLLKTIDGQDSLLVSRQHLKLSLENIDQVKEGLIGVVSRVDGTAHSLDELGLKIAGKTGTAQTKGLDHGWFVGFFPYDQPKYSICVMLENAGTSHEAVNSAYAFLKRAKEENLL